MYEASLEIVGFVLLHKVPKNRLPCMPDGGFENFRPIVNFRLIDSRSPSRRGFSHEKVKIAKAVNFQILSKK